jgi:Mrp family chromosome partitioning ATPase/capsular polysaccharide biosynthesis protein
MPGPVPFPVAQPARALRHFRTVLQRWLWFLALCTLLGSAGAFVVSMLMHPTYRATALLVVGSPTTGGADPNSTLLASDQLVTTYLGLITQPVVLQRAAAQVPGVSAHQLTGQVSVKDQAGTQIIELNVDDTSSIRAARLANAVAAAFIGTQQESSAATLARAQQQVDQQLAQVSAQITTLTAQLNALGTQDPTNQQFQALQQQRTAALAHQDALQTVSSQLATQQITAANSVSVFQPATPPLVPDHPKPLLNAAIGGALGLVIAGALIWLLEFFDDHIRTPHEAEELLGLPVLATLGSYPRRALLEDAASGRKLALEARTLVANIELAYPADIPRTFAVTSAVGGEGRTTIAISLATALARKGKRVLLVDGDLHQSSRRDVTGGKRLTPAHAGDSHVDISELLDSPVDLTHPFGLSQILTRWVRSANEGGTSREKSLRRVSVLTGGIEAQPEATPLPTMRGVPGLYVLPAGPGLPDPSEVFRSSHMRQFLQWLTDDPAGGRFDAIVLDTPPTTIYPDAALLARWVDATVLVVNTVRSSEEALRRVKDIFQRAHVSIIGAVLNRASGQAHHDYYVDDLAQAPSLEPQAPHVRSPVRAEENGRANSTTPLPGEPTARTSPTA